MSVRILFFGKLRDIVGMSEYRLGCLPDTDSLKRALFAQFPELSHQQIILTLNHEVIHGNSIIKDGDEIGFLPPVSGG